MARKPHKDIAADDTGYIAYMREEVSHFINLPHRTIRRVGDRKEWVDLPDTSPEEKLVRWFSHPAVLSTDYCRWVRECIKGKDWGRLCDAIWQYGRFCMLPGCSAGTPVYDIRFGMTGWACNDASFFERCFPRTRTPFKSNLFLYCQLINFLLGLWYGRQEILDAALPHARRYLASKQPKKHRAEIGFLIALVENRPDVASEQLDTLCKLAPRGAIWETDEELILCLHAHALYELAWLRGPSGFAERIALPERSNFCAPYATWLAGHPEYRPSLYVTFPEDLEILNRILEAPIQRQVLTYKVLSDAPHARPELIKDEEATLREFLRTIPTAVEKSH